MKFCCLVTMSIILVAGIVSCTGKNKEIVSPDINSKTLPGAWELRGTSGGMIPYNPDNFKPGNGNVRKFTSDHFEFLLHDSVYNSGTYTVTHTGVDLNSNRTINQLILNDMPAESFELKNDTLNIYYGAIVWDGVIQHYIKTADAQ